MKKLIIITAIGAFIYWAHDGLWFLFNIFMRAMPDINRTAALIALGLLAAIIGWMVRNKIRMEK